MNNFVTERNELPGYIHRLLHNIFTDLVTSNSFLDLNQQQWNELVAVWKSFNSKYDIYDGSDWNDVNYYVVLDWTVSNTPRDLAIREDTCPLDVSSTHSSTTMTPTPICAIQ